MCVTPAKNSANDFSSCSVVSQSSATLVAFVAFGMQFDLGHVQGPQTAGSNKVTSSKLSSTLVAQGSFPAPNCSLQQIQSICFRTPQHPTLFQPPNRPRCPLRHRPILPWVQQLRLLKASVRLGARFPICPLWVGYNSVSASVGHPAVEESPRVLGMNRGSSI